MKIRTKKAPASRKFVNGDPPQQDPAQPYTFPAPIRGWVLNENLATTQPAAARILDNWFCTTTGIRVRGGSVKYATVTGSVQSLFTYNSTVDKFFAASGTAIYDITTPASPTTPITAAVTSRTSGKYSTAQFGTAGGNYLYALNGTDAPLLYDGTSWQAVTGVSTPIAITGVTTTSLSHVWAFANRLFFIEKNTMKAWYLSVDSIAGAVSTFSLAGVFSKGGSLLFGAKWSLDAGDGLDDKCIFISTEGEIAVYRGTNPGSAADWVLEGIYQMPPPLGERSSAQAGGDLLIATETGLIPISASVQTDLAAIESKAVSAPISPYWQDQVGALSGNWEIIKTPRKGVMIVSQPDATGANPTALAINLLTGAWSRVTGWDTQSLGYFADNGYFGASDGCIYLMDSGGSDNGAVYTAAYLGSHSDMGVPGAQKTVLQMRAMFQTGSPILPLVGALANFSEDTGTPPGSPAQYTVDRWDQGLWDVAIWDAASSTVNQASWTAAGVTGSTIAPLLQLSFGITPTPEVELVSIDTMYRVGAPVA